MGLPATEYKLHKVVKKVNIYLEPRANAFPLHWEQSPINAEQLPLAETLYEQSLTVIGRALRKYPGEVDLKLSEIHVAKSLKFYGVSFGGTYVAPCARNRILLTNDDYTDEFFERLFHAEYSSVLLKTYPEYFDEVAWVNTLPNDFAYGNYSTGDIATLQMGEPLEQFESAFLEQGFLSYYAMTNMENDFYSVVKNLFVPNEDFIEALRYPRVKAKVDLTMKFYSKLHPEFTQRFASLWQVIS